MGDFLMKMGKKKIYFPEVQKKMLWVGGLKVGR